MIELITGGARSGKSRRAEELLLDSAEVLYIATAQIFDDEMKERVRRHRESRPSHWKTHEGYRRLDRAVHETAGDVLLDCVTNFCSNILFERPADWDAPTQEDIDAAESDILMETEAFLAAMKQYPQRRFLLVTNELGMGVVPPTPLGRLFRDIAGRVNQRIAAEADRVVLMVSGIPVTIKGDG